MLHLALPIASALASFGPAEPPTTESVGDLIPEGTFAALRIASADRFTAVFDALDEVFAPDDRSPASEALDFLLTVRPETLLRDEPIILTFGPMGAEPGRGFMIPVADTDGFVAELEELFGEDLVTEVSGDYVGFTIGAPYVAGGSRIGESWPADWSGASAVVGRVDMVAVNGTFGPMVTQGLALMEMQVAELPQPEGSDADLSAMAEFMTQVAQGFMTTADVVDLSVDVVAGELVVQTDMTFIEGSHMTTLGSTEPANYAKVLGTAQGDSLVEFVLHTDWVHALDWMEPMYEFMDALGPVAPGYSFQAMIESYSPMYAVLGDATVGTFDLDPSGFSTAMVYERKPSTEEGSATPFSIMMESIQSMGGTAKQLAPIQIEGVKVEQFEGHLGPGVLEPDAEEMPETMRAFMQEAVSSVAEFKGLMLFHTCSSAEESASGKLAGAIRQAKAPTQPSPGIAKSLKELGASNPAAAMTLNLAKVTTLVQAMGGVPAEDAPQFAADARVRIHGGVQGRRWHGLVALPLDAMASLVALGR